MSKNKDSLYTKFADKFGMMDEAELKRILKATAFKIKEGEVSDEQLYALLVVADEYGLNPFTREIFAYPDKQNGIVPVVSVDGWSRIINQHPQMDGVSFVYDTTWITDMSGAKPCPASITCVIYRKDRNHPVQITEFLDETYRPPFVGKGQTNQSYTVNGPWQSHTKRMLRHKALIQCARIAFGFVGIYDDDEALRIIEARNSSPDGEEGLDVQGKPSDKAVTILPKLVARATREGSWTGALEHAKANYTGIDLNYLLKELNQAKQQANAALPPITLDQPETLPAAAAVGVEGSEDSGKPSDKAVSALPRIIAKATRENSWTEALAHVSANYTGIDLAYLNQGLEKARQEMTAALSLSSQADANPKIPPPADPKKLNGSGKASPLADARAALGQAADSQA